MPRITVAGSPGTASRAPNTTTLASRTLSRAVRKRRTTKASISRGYRGQIGRGRPAGPPPRGALPRAVDAHEVDRRRGLVGPEAVDVLLGRDQVRRGEHPDVHRVLGDDAGDLLVLGGRLLLRPRGLRLGEELGDARVVVVVVVARVRVDVDVARLRVTDDGHVVVAAEEDPLQPGRPLHDRELDLDPDLRELLRDDLAGAALDRVRLRQLEPDPEAVRVTGLGQELLGALGVVRVRVGEVDVVVLGRAHVRADHGAEAEERAL